MGFEGFSAFHDPVVLNSTLHPCTLAKRMPANCSELLAVSLSRGNNPTKLPNAKQAQVMWRAQKPTWLHFARFRFGPVQILDGCSPVGVGAYSIHT